MALLLPAAGSFGQTFISTNNYELNADSVVDGQLWVYSSTIDMSGTAPDDVQLFGGEVTLSGEVMGDIWALGERITLSGHTKDHARLMSSKYIRASGSFEHDVLAVSESIELDTNVLIKGSAVLIGRNISSLGHVEKSLSMTGLGLTLGGEVDGDVHLIGDDITVLPRTRIKGDLIYTATSELFLDPSVAIDGELKRHIPQAATKEGGRTRSLWFSAFFFLASLLTGTFFLGLFPAPASRCVGAVRAQTRRCLLVGLAATVVFPVLTGVALVSIIGIPFGLLIGSLFFQLMYLGKLVVAIALGTYMLRMPGPKSFASMWRAFLLGLVVLYFAANLPTLSFVVWYFSSTIGLGAFLVAIMDVQEKPTATAIAQVVRPTKTAPQTKTLDAGNTRKEELP